MNNERPIEDLIIDIVCECFRISKPDLIGQSKKMEHVFPRYALCHLLIDNTYYPVDKIALISGRGYKNNTARRSKIQSELLLKANPHYRYNFEKCIPKMKEIFKQTKS